MIHQYLHCSLAATQEELHEFQQQSRELEHELETQLEQSETKNAQLSTALQRAETERDMLRVRSLTFGYDW
jgi:t-SNARE complex subunit (syntaxin)